MLLMRRTPAAVEARRQPRRRRADRDVGDRARSSAGSSSGSSMVTVQVRSAAGCAGRRHRADRAAGSGSRSAVATSRARPIDAQAVGPVGGDLEVDHRLRRRALDRRRPRSRAARASRAIVVGDRPARRRTRAARRDEPSQRELLQEAQVVLVEQADVVDAALQQRQRARCPCRTRSRCTARGRSRPLRRRRDAPCRCRAPRCQPVCLHMRAARCRRTTGSRCRPRRSARCTGRSSDGSATARSGAEQLAQRTRSACPSDRASVMPSPTTRPSTCWNIGVCVRSRLSRR